MGKKKGGSKKGQRGRKTPALVLNSEYFVDDASENSTPRTPRSAASRRRPHDSGESSSDDGGFGINTVVDQLHEAVTQATTKHRQLRMDGFSTLIKLLRTNCVEEVEEAGLASAILGRALDTMRKGNGAEFRLAVKVLLLLSVFVASGSDIDSFYPNVYAAISVRVRRWKAAEQKDREDKLRGGAADGRDSADVESSTDTALVADMVALLGCACFLNSTEMAEVKECSQLLQSLLTPPKAAIDQWLKDEGIVAAASSSATGFQGNSNQYNWVTGEDDDNYDYDYDYGESDTDGDGVSDSDETSSDSDVEAGVASSTDYESLLRGSNPILAQAISSWTLLLNGSQYVTDRSLTSSLAERQGVLRTMAFWLGHSDVRVQLAATKCIGVFHELCGDELAEDAESDETESSSSEEVAQKLAKVAATGANDGTPPHLPTQTIAADVEAAASSSGPVAVTGSGTTGTTEAAPSNPLPTSIPVVEAEAEVEVEETVNWLPVIGHLLESRRTESVKRRHKRDRKASRRPFALLGQSLDGEPYGGEKEVLLSSENTVLVDTWAALARYEMLCLVLAEGVAAHAQSSESVLRSVLNVVGTRAKMTKLEKQAKSKGRGRSHKAASVKKYR